MDGGRNHLPVEMPIGIPMKWKWWNYSRILPIYQLVQDFFHSRYLAIPIFFLQSNNRLNKLVGKSNNYQLCWRFLCLHLHRVNEQLPIVSNCQVVKRSINNHSTTRISSHGGLTSGEIINPSPVELPKISWSSYLMRTCLKNERETDQKAMV